ncbi:hypothetical protein NPIL_206401 [Nephila pilipes]|uniref:Uncharacterized protein n=1 Tax=Nephila pilipes TaxID=299642 RepID=A0A8X6UCD6_NEPPI|nr:hypothetical protein NPIL_206401 [Nephila pilipes]
MSADTILPASMNTQTINALITQELSDEIILAAQDDDDDIQKIKSFLQEGKHKNKEKYFINDNSGLLMHISFHQNYLKEDICLKTIKIPHSLKKPALRQAHLPHLGIDKMYFILKETFFGTECTLIPSTMSHPVYPVADTRESLIKNKHMDKHPSQRDRLTEEGYTNTLLSSLQVLQQQIRTNLEKQQDKQQARLNSNTTQRAPKVDVVFTLSGNQFRPKFDGPFEVIKKPNKHTCIIRELDNPRAPELKVNTHKLKISCRRFDYLKTNGPNQFDVQTTHQGPLLRPRLLQLSTSLHL